MSARDLAQAESALAHWGALGAPLRLVWESENVVYATQLRDGSRVALRLHRPGYQGRDAIETELEWCERLAQAGVPVARPVRALNGRLTAGLGGRVVSCLRWIEGAPLGQAGQALAGSAVAARAGDVGALIADLHSATDAGACPAPFDRAAWDAEALLGERPRWGRFWENPSLDPTEQTTLLRARDFARKAVEGAVDYGPIHADVIRTNVMAGPGGLTLIDFDDSGPGWRLYDLASVLVQSWGDQEMGAQVRALVQGYRSRRALPDDQLELLPLFVALRCMASAGWVVTRAADDPARIAAYARRAVEAAEALLARRVPWEGGGS